MAPNGRVGLVGREPFIPPVQEGNREGGITVTITTIPSQLPPSTMQLLSLHRASPKVTAQSCVLLLLPAIAPLNSATDPLRVQGV